MEAPGLREGHEGRENQAPTDVPVFLHEDVKLMIEEKNEEKDHVEPSLLENDEDTEKRPITAFQCHQTQHEEQEMVEHVTCLPPSIDQHERLQVFQDLFARLLKSLAKGICIASTYYGFWFCLESLFPTFLYLLGESVSRVRGISQLLDWLHWHFYII